jgi:hypothetical protein
MDYDENGNAFFFPRFLLHVILQIIVPGSDTFSMPKPSSLLIITRFEIFIPARCQPGRRMAEPTIVRVESRSEDLDRYEPCSLELEKCKLDILVDRSDVEICIYPTLLFKNACNEIVNRQF